MARTGTYGNTYDAIDVPLVVHAIVTEKSIKRPRISELKLGDVIWVQSTQTRYRHNERWAPRRVLVLHYRKSNNQLYVIDSNGARRDRAILDQFDHFVNTDMGRPFIADEGYYVPGFTYHTGRGRQWNPGGPNNSYSLNSAVVLCMGSEDPNKVYQSAVELIKARREQEHTDREAAHKEEWIAKAADRLQTDYGQDELRFAEYGIEARYSELYAGRPADEDSRMASMIWTVHLNDEQGKFLLGMLQVGAFPRGTLYPEGKLPATMAAAKKRLRAEARA